MFADALLSWRFAVGMSPVFVVVVLSLVVAWVIPPGRGLED